MEYIGGYMEDRWRFTITDFSRMCEDWVSHVRRSWKHYGSKRHDDNLQETLNGSFPMINTYEHFDISAEAISNYMFDSDGLIDVHGGSKRKEKYQTVVDEEKEEEDRENEKAARKELEKRFCEICRKKFSCQKQYENHLASKAHKKKILDQKNKTVATVSRNKERRTTKNVVGFSKERINSISSSTNHQLSSPSSYIPRRPLILNGRYMDVHICCLFCDERNQSLEYIMEHMAKSHSFVIPDLEDCVNPIGLLLHLAEIVYFNFQCIDFDCREESGKKWKSYNAVRMHMIAKGKRHCEIFFVDYIDIFYDYTNRPDDETAEPEELSKVHEANCKLLESSDVNKAQDQAMAS
ncbi:uncharacterized protein [Temnothorax longispinosus]|uniref:uncharacterized protein n=1 Tax=Temnothorax longispinosus TaxID=300112 RepID=UPI003A9A5D73